MSPTVTEVYRRIKEEVGSWRLAGLLHAEAFGFDARWVATGRVGFFYRGAGTPVTALLPLCGVVNCHLVSPSIKS
jgi:hypothetical protein